MDYEESDKLLACDEEDILTEREHVQDISISSYETALKKTGFGKFNVLLLVVCGWAQISDSMEILCISFILPVAGEEMKWSDKKEGIINSVIFVGMMIGGYVWGSLADIRGRRGILIYSLATNAIFGLCSSFASSYWLFLVLRLLSGIGVGGTIPVVFSYFGEFQQRAHRGAMISALSTCWMLGNILTAGLAWWIIPMNLSYLHPNESWRIFIVICVIPAATSAITFIFLPESPKFLLESGEERRALSVLKTMYKANKCNSSLEEYPIKQLIPENKRHARDDGRSSLLRVLHSTVQLFKLPLTRITFSILTIVFCLSFGYYGIWMWFPKIFAQVEYGNGTACSNKPVVIPKNDKSGVIYQDAFLAALSNLPGNILTIFFMDKLGRRFLMGLSLLLSGVSVFFLWFVNTRIQVLITSMCFGGTSVIAWNALNVLGVELFPTHLRSTSFGVQSVVNRTAAICGNLMFGFLIHFHCSIPLLTVAVLFGFAGLVTFTLPNTTKMSLR